MANTVERVHYREKAERSMGKARVGVPGDIDAWGHKRRLTLDRFSGPAKVRPEAVRFGSFASFWRSPADLTSSVLLGSLKPQSRALSVVLFDQVGALTTAAYNAHCYCASRFADGRKRVRTRYSSPRDHDSSVLPRMSTLIATKGALVATTRT
jgi:hypothetical protein